MSWMKPSRRRRDSRCRVAAVVVTLACGGVPCGLLPGTAAAEERPKWELGAGGVFYTQPDYVGSDEYRFHAFPFPWIVYRGSRLRLDRESIQTKIFGTDLVRLDLSASGQIPVDSNDNDRRHGMPDLDWIAQLGPTLRFTLMRSVDGRHALDFDVPLRVALAVDTDNFSYEGLVSSPKFQYRYEPEQWRFEGNAGLEFSSNDYNEYVYGVAPRFATASRPAYGADGGYAGVRIAAGVSRYFGPVYLGVFARYINIDGAAFEDSPLVGSRSAFIGGLAVGWVWFSSKEMVPVGAEANIAARPSSSHDADVPAVPPRSSSTTTEPSGTPPSSPPAPPAHEAR